MSIELIKNGPAIFRMLEEDARITVVGTELKEPMVSKNNVVAICRCSKSNNHPFCDGNHMKTETLEKEMD